MLLVFNWKNRNRCTRMYHKPLEREIVEKENRKRTVEKEKQKEKAEDCLPFWMWMKSC